MSLGESAPKKAQVRLPANEVKTRVSCKSRDINQIDYIQKERKISANSLDQLNENLKKKLPLTTQYKMFFTKTMHECTLSALLPGFSPNDYFPFFNFKRCLSDLTFFENFEISFYFEGVRNCRFFCRKACV